jgi:hypothetical protein
MSKPVVVTIPHHLSKEEAKSRLQNGFGHIRAQLASHLVGKLSAVEDRWVEDRMEFRLATLGQSVTGRVDVMDDSVRVEIDLPWLLARLAESLRGRISREATRLLEKK